MAYGSPRTVANRGGRDQSARPLRHQHIQSKMGAHRVLEMASAFPARLCLDGLLDAFMLLRRDTRRRGRPLPCRRIRRARSRHVLFRRAALARDNLDDLRRIGRRRRLGRLWDAIIQRRESSLRQTPTSVGTVEMICGLRRLLVSTGLTCDGPAIPNPACPSSGSRDERSYESSNPRRVGWSAVADPSDASGRPSWLL